MASRLKCGTHGERERRFVCDHIFKNEESETPTVMRYFEPEHEVTEPTPAIWCESCEEVIFKEGEVNNIADEFAKFHMVCDFCFKKYIDANAPASAT